MQIFKSASQYAKDYSVSAEALADFLREETERLGFIRNGDNYRDCLRVRVAVDRFIQGGEL